MSNLDVYLIRQELHKVLMKTVMTICNECEGQLDNGECGASQINHRCYEMRELFERLFKGED